MNAGVDQWMGRNSPLSDFGVQSAARNHEKAPGKFLEHYFAPFPNGPLVSVVCPAMVGVPASDACVLKGGETRTQAEGAGCRLRFVLLLKTAGSCAIFPRVRLTLKFPIVAFRVGLVPR